jgi:hypothetical protein
MSDSQTRVILDEVARFPDRPDLAGYKTEIERVPSTTRPPPGPLLLVYESLRRCTLMIFYSKDDR